MQSVDLAKVSNPTSLCKKKKKEAQLKEWHSTLLCPSSLTIAAWFELGIFAKPGSYLPVKRWSLVSSSHL